MTRRYGGVCCVYDDDTWLPMMLRGCYSVVDRLFFLVAHRPWNGNASDNHRTISAIRSCADDDHKIVIVEGDWPSEAEQRNVGLDLCARAGLSYCLIVDADEIYDPNALRFMMEATKLRPEADAWHVRHVTYWKSYRFRIDPLDPRPAVIFANTERVQFIRGRSTNARIALAFPSHFGVCHHLSYARTDEQISKKIARFSHAPEILPEWFEQVWLGWDNNPSMENLHPVNPSEFRRAVRQDPALYPPVLRQLYERDQAALRGC